METRGIMGDFGKIEECRAALRTPPAGSPSTCLEVKFMPDKCIQLPFEVPESAGPRGGVQYAFVCEACGGAFTRPAKQVNQSRKRGVPIRYCSTECRTQASKTRVLVTLHCERCGHAFQRPASYVRGKEKADRHIRFCSQECRKGLQEEPVNIVCEGCGRTYLRPAYEARRGRIHFCSRACRSIGAQISLTCGECGKQFMRRRSLHSFHLRHGGTAIYCSKECVSRATGRRIAERARVSRIQRDEDTPILVCATCGTAFQKSHKHWRNSKHCRHHYCSKPCFDARPLDAVETKCQVCGKPFIRHRSRHAKVCSPECKHAQLARLAKKRDPRHTFGGWFSKKGIRPDLGHRVRSTWEANFCRILNAMEIPYEYEPKVFDLGDCRYLPDFRIAGTYWVEIKGWATEASLSKVEKFRQLYPDQHIEVVGADLYKQLEREWKDRIPQWEFWWKKSPLNSEAA